MGDERWSVLSQLIIVTFNALPTNLALIDSWTKTLSKLVNFSLLHCSNIFRADFHRSERANIVKKKHDRMAPKTLSISRLDRKRFISQKWHVNRQNSRGFKKWIKERGIHQFWWRVGWWRDSLVARWPDTHRTRSNAHACMFATVQLIRQGTSISLNFLRPNVN